MVTTRIPKLFLKKFVLFFTIYKNEGKEHKFQRQKKKKKKVTFTKIKKHFK